MLKELTKAKILIVFLLFVFWMVMNYAYALWGVSNWSGTTVTTGSIGTAPALQPRIMRASKPRSRGLKRFGLYRFESSGIVIVKARKREHTFVNSGTSAKLLYSGNDSQPKYVINGSYFWRTESGDFMPAGTLGSGGISVFHSTLCDDVNLCSSYNLKTLDIQQKVTSWFVWANHRSSWPWLTREGIINPDLSESRSHWQRKTTRTAMASPMGGSPGAYFIFSNTGYTLWNFAQKLTEILPGASVINLDGGSSTSFASKNLKFGATKRLPEFFLLW
jgi:hypothetical protein